MSSRYKAYFFKLKPNGAQTRDFAGSCGCARLVCNKGIEWYNEQRKQNPEFRFSCTALANLFSQWTQEEDKKWLAKGHSQMLQQAFKDLERGFINFWEGRTNFPKFHKKFQSTNNFRSPQAFKIDEGGRQPSLPKRLGEVSQEVASLRARQGASLSVAKPAAGLLRF